ncbi:MAG: hypothetical protein HY827_03570 [Actinobacteria bacterium]|nr:hypothetical protein [Actinomycetota bacterium]
MSADGRVKVTSISRTPVSIELALEIEPQDGAHTCPSNPPTYVDVPLSEPIGARDLVDVGSVPANTQLSVRQLTAIRSGANVADELLFDKTDREFCKDRFVGIESRQLLSPSASQSRRFAARSRQCR